MKTPEGFPEYIKVNKAFFHLSEMSNKDRRNWIYEFEYYFEQHVKDRNGATWIWEGFPFSKNQRKVLIDYVRSCGWNIKIIDKQIDDVNISEIQIKCHGTLKKEHLVPVYICE